MENQETVEQTEQPKATDEVVNSPAFQEGLKKVMAQDNETDKDKNITDSVESVETFESLEYDRNANSRIEIVIPRGISVYRTQIEFAPVTDDEFFALMEETQALGERAKKLSTEFFEPFIKLGKKKAVGASGYLEKSGGWQSAVSDADYSQGISKLIDAQTRQILEETDAPFDPDAPVKMGVAFLDNRGYETKKHIFYKSVAKIHIDEFLAARLGEPSPSALASAAKKPLNQRLFALAKQLHVDSDYQNGIPGWHLIYSVSVYLEAEISRMGKF